MKKSFILFAAFATVIMFSACKNEGATTATETTPTTDTEASEATSATDLDAPGASDVPTGPTTTIEFENSTYDFGTIADSEKVQYSYKFKNTGNEPLVISNAKGSCGCTVPNWPREPIAPGSTGEIMVEFDSKGKGKEGGQKQTKRVTVTGNTDPANTFLTITGTVNKTDM
jgi:hypothetical protein